jgi:hypothetical protein
MERQVTSVVIQGGTQAAAAQGIRDLLDIRSIEQEYFPTFVWVLARDVHIELESQVRTIGI